MEGIHSPFHPGVSRVFYKHVAGNPPKPLGQGKKVHVTQPRSARFLPLQQPHLQNSVEPEGARRKWDQTTNVLQSMHEPRMDPAENPPAHWSVPPPAPPDSLTRWLCLPSRAARLRSEKRSRREKRAFFTSFPCPSVPPSRHHFSPLPFLASPDSAPPRPPPAFLLLARSSACARPWRGGARVHSDRPVLRPPSAGQVGVPGRPVRLLSRRLGGS